MKITIFEGFKTFSKNSKSKGFTELTKTVQNILSTVQKNGDLALSKYTKQFDKILPETWLVPKSAIKKALSFMEKDLIKILEEASNNIMSFHESQKSHSQLDFNQDGTIL